MYQVKEVNKSRDGYTQIAPGIEAGQTENPFPNFFSGHQTETDPVIDGMTLDKKGWASITS